MITVHWLFTLAGLMFAAFALLSALDGTNPKRFGNAAFNSLRGPGAFSSPGGQTGGRS